MSTQCRCMRRDPYRAPELCDRRDCGKAMPLTRRELGRSPTPRTDASPLAHALERNRATHAETVEVLCGRIAELESQLHRALQFAPPPPIVLSAPCGHGDCEKAAHGALRGQLAKDADHG